MTGLLMNDRNTNFSSNLDSLSFILGLWRVITSDDTVSKLIVFTALCRAARDELDRQLTTVVFLYGGKEIISFSGCSLFRAVVPFAFYRWLYVTLYLLPLNFDALLDSILLFCPCVLVSLCVNLV